VGGTNHIILEGCELEFFVGMAVAKNALGKYPDRQAQPVIAGHSNG